MAKVTVTAEAPSGEVFTKEVEDTEISTYRKKAEDMKYKFSVSAPLTGEETKAAESGVLQQTSMRESALGGLLQGVSLGTEDVIGEGTEALRQRQEAEHPYIYGGAKFLGSLVPTISLAGAGAAAGAAAGAPFGGVGAIPGAVIGGTLGGMSGAAGAGTIESYASKPTPAGGKKLELSDVGAGLLSGVTEGVGQYVAPAARALYRGIRGKLLPSGTAVTRGATELTERGINEAVIMLNKLKSNKMKIAANKAFASTDDLINASDEEIYDKLDLPDAQEAIDLKNSYKKAIVALGGTDTTPVDAAIEILENRIKQLQGSLGGKLGQPATSSIIGGAAAAVPMIDPGVQLTPYEIGELNRQAAGRAFEEAQRRKIEQLMNISEAEAAVRSGIDARIPGMLEKAQKKKKK